MKYTVQMLYAPVVICLLCMLLFPVSDLGQLVTYSPVVYNHSFMSMVPIDDDHYNDLAMSLYLQCKKTLRNVRSSPSLGQNTRSNHGCPSMTLSGLCGC